MNGIKERLAKFRDARIKELEKQLQERDERIQVLENRLNTQAEMYAIEWSRHREATELLKSLGIEATGCIWHTVLDVALLLVNSGSDQDGTARRNGDAQDYCMKYVPGNGGKNVWHTVLDDAIKLRAEREQSTDYEHLMKLLKRITDLETGIRDLEAADTQRRQLDAEVRDFLGKAVLRASGRNIWAALLKVAKEMRHERL